MRSVSPTEHQIQCAIVEWSTKVFFEHPGGGKSLLRPYLLKIPNEGKRSCSQGKKMKAEGLTKGVSDLFLAIPKKTFSGCDICDEDVVYCGLWLEIKKPGKKPSEEQAAFLCAMRDIGYHADWTDDVEKGINLIKDYLGII